MSFVCGEIACISDGDDNHELLLSCNLIFIIIPAEQSSVPPTPPLPSRTEQPEKRYLWHDTAPISPVQVALLAVPRHHQQWHPLMLLLLEAFAALQFAAVGYHILIDLRQRCLAPIFSSGEGGLSLGGPGNSCPRMRESTRGLVVSGRIDIRHRNKFCCCYCCCCCCMYRLP